jgi:hypothetical protein
MEKEKLLKTKIEKPVSGTVEQTTSYSQNLLLIGTICFNN